MRNERINRRVAGNINDREAYYQTYAAGQLRSQHDRHAQEPVAWYNRGIQESRSAYETSRAAGGSCLPSTLLDNDARAKPSTLLVDCSELSRFDKHPQEPMISRFDAFHRSKIVAQPLGYRHDSYHHPTRHVPPKAAAISAAHNHNHHSTISSHIPGSPTHGSPTHAHSRSMDHYSSLTNLPSMDLFRLNPPQKKHRMGPVIFLDIDGVVHPVQVTREYQLFRRDKMSLLRHLVQQSNAQIVLSSAWRLAPRTMQIVNQQLVRHGLEKVIDKTADHGYAGKRSAEILAWVKQHEPSAWIAIDDMDLACDESRLTNHFLHTNSQIGLTAEQCELGLRLLRMGA